MDKNTGIRRVSGRGSMQENDNASNIESSLDSKFQKIMKYENFQYNYYQSSLYSVDYRK